MFKRSRNMSKIDETVEYSIRFNIYKNKNHPMDTLELTTIISEIENLVKVFKRLECSKHRIGEVGIRKTGRTQIKSKRKKE